MCGIAGGLRIESETLDRMLASLHHRGPDDLGVQRGNSFSIGMTRLAILDLANGRQPFRDTSAKISAVCNGEIYNWRELRNELTSKGHRFETSCDCEILPAAWLEWGPELVNKLNGMFALAILDEREESLFLARDRCGQKPLYYTSSGSFHFASEVKALAAAGVSLIPDATQVGNWLSLRYLPEPQTLFRDIVTLPAAHSLMVDRNGQRSLTRYWHPLPTEREVRSFHDEKEAVDELDALTRSSVEKALQADVPLAAYLSAGVDSSLLAYYLKDLGADVTTTAIGFGASSDETGPAAQFAKDLALPHQGTTLTPKSLADLPRVIQQMDRPVGDALILAFDHLASHTSSLGCKVALGGEGPDEHFAGYSFQKALITAEKLGSFGRSSAAAAIQLAPEGLLNRMANFPASLGREGRQKVVSYLRGYSKASPFTRVSGLHTLFNTEEISNLLTEEILAQQEGEPVLEIDARHSFFDNALASQYQSWLPDWSLIRQDKNTMAHSLEYRAPFLDHRLIDFAFALPQGLKVHKGKDKYLWRQLAARHLPSEVTNRPKQPFYLPLEEEQWRTPFLSLAREVLTRKAVEEQGWFQFSAVESLFAARSFLPLKQLAACVILQLWLDGLTSERAICSSSY